MIQSQFSEAEIKECVMACAHNKAPGPDGFTMTFFTNCWEIVSKVVAAVQNIFERSFNAHLHSLIGSIYKIISKCSLRG